MSIVFSDSRSMLRVLGGPRGEAPEEGNYVQDNSQQVILVYLEDSCGDTEGQSAAALGKAGKPRAIGV